MTLLAVYGPVRLKSNFFDGLCHPEVSRRTPDLIPNLKNNLFAAGIFCLTSLSLLQVCAQSFVSLLQASCESVC